MSSTNQQQMLSARFKNSSPSQANFDGSQIKSSARTLKDSRIASCSNIFTRNGLLLAVGFKGTTKNYIDNNDNKSLERESLSQ
jgi:CRISPR/Cas system CMR-associated protein Cmr5 small subunit